MTERKSAPPTGGPVGVGRSGRRDSVWQRIGRWALGEGGEGLSDARVAAMNHSSETRCDQYRDLLETWAEWWNGPGRQGYRDPIIPPITATGDALRCSICAGINEPGERCQACGRRL